MTNEQVQAKIKELKGEYKCLMANEPEQYDRINELYWEISKLYKSIGQELAEDELW